ncbi:serine/threonine protein kinase, partial [Streptomyces sp. SID10115]
GATNGTATSGTAAYGSTPNGSAGGPPRVPAKASLTDVVPRRTLVIVTMVVVLAVLGTVLALALGDDNADSKDNKGGDKAASAGATGGNPGKDDDKDSGKDSGQGTGTGTGDDGKDPGKDESSGPDDGKSDDPGKDDDAKKPEDGAESTYKHSQGFKIGLPKGWKYQSTGRAGARFGGPDGQKLLVGWTTTPKDNPVADWKNQEKFMVRPQYDRIRIEKVGFRGWNTADWEFTYVDGGTKYRSIDRGFVVNGGLGYGMMYTAKADDWGSEKRRATWRTLTKTFEPKS